MFLNNAIITVIQAKYGNFWVKMRLFSAVWKADLRVDRS